METADSYRFAGQTITMSFYARAGANFSSASSVLNLLFTTGTGTNEANGNQSGWTGAVQTSRNNTLTTSWQRFTQTFTIPSNVTQIGWVFGYTPVGTAGANDYYEITGCQLELGSYATTFSRAGGTIQGELAVCQRYFQLIGENNGIFGAIISTTTAYLWTMLPVVMRIAPTATYPAGPYTSGVNELGIALRTPTTLATFGNTTRNISFYADGASGMTAPRPVAYSLSSTIQLNSEL
jgi:hypothetical protein